MQHKDIEALMLLFERLSTVSRKTLRAFGGTVLVVHLGFPSQDTLTRTIGQQEPVSCGIATRDVPERGLNKMENSQHI